MKYEMGSSQKSPFTSSLSQMLIVRTDKLGDVVLTLPMARAIKKAFPDARISFLAREYTRPIIERCPDVDEIRVIEDRTSFWKLIRQFRVVQTAFFPSPRFRLALAAFFARVPKRIGTGYRWYSFLFTDRIYEHRKTAEHHEAEYNLRMLSTLGITAESGELPFIRLHEAEKKEVDAWMKDNIPTPEFAVLHIMSGGSSQQWPIQNFVELGIALAGRDGMSIVLTGTLEESSVISSAANAIGGSRAFPFIGHPLAELAALLERASVVIAASTGPGHLAAALGTPSIGLFPLPLAISKTRWGFRGPLCCEHIARAGQRVPELRALHLHGTNRHGNRTPISRGRVGSPEQTRGLIQFFR